MEADFLSIDEFQKALAARGVKLSQQRIRAALADGTLRGIKPLLRKWYVAASELERILQMPPADAEQA